MENLAFRDVLIGFGGLALFTIVFAIGFHELAEKRGRERADMAAKKAARREADLARGRDRKRKWRQ